jgi:DNA-binding NtrC family response regulator
MVSEGGFREDLFYRLNVIPVRLPPLRERREDIPLLVQHFLQRIGKDQVPPRPFVTVSQDAMRRLMSYPWPGNVRQLENIVERALTLSPGRSQIEVSDLPIEVQNAFDPAIASTAVELPAQGIDFDAYIGRIEKALIDQALAKTGGNKRQAAEMLKLKRTTLIEKLKRL